MNFINIYGYLYVSEIKVVKKRKSRLKKQNDSQLELTFVESSKRKNKDISPRLKKLKKSILIKSPFKKKPLAKSA